MNVRLILLVIPAFAAGCEATRMAVPADITTASEELAITDRSSWTGALADESFNLGSYKVADVDRKWNSKEITTLGAMESTESSGGYKFNFLGTGNPLSGVCESENRGRSADLAGGLSFGSMVAKLSCRCGDATASAELALQASTSEVYEGVLKRGDGSSARVLSINEREGGGNTHDPTGYRVDADGTPLGAVDVMGTGRVWVSKALQGRQRDELACLFAGLLLYQTPKER